MNVNPLVISALAPMNMPVEPNVYEGVKENYITFNYADERPALNADDEDILDETIVDIHCFTKSDPQSHKKAIRRYMRTAGFSIMDTQELYEDDTKYTHIVVTCAIGGTVDDEE